MPILSLVRALLLTTAVFLSPPVLSDVLILTPDTDYGKNVAEQLKSRIASPSRITHSLDINPDTELVVALGRDSFLEASSKAEVPVIGSFLSPLDQVDGPGNGPRYRIFSDPSPGQIAEFLASRFPNSVIGYIYTAEEAQVVKDVHDALKGSSTRLESLPFSGNTFSDIRELSRKGINAMLLTKNRDIYNPERVRFVLEALFRKKMPVVSTSTALVPAGATVSIAPSPEAIIDATSGSVNRLLKEPPNAPPAAAYVEHATVQVNRTMSEYFDIDFGGEAP